MLVRKKFAEGSGSQARDRLLYAISLNDLGVLHKKRGENESAARLLKEAVDHHERLQDDPQFSAYNMTRNLCGSAYEYASTAGVDETAALEANARALEMALRLPGFREFTPSIEHIVLAPTRFLCVMAMRYFGKNDYDTAEAYFSKSFEARKELFAGLKTWLCAQMAAESARDAGNCVIEQGKQKNALKEYRRKAQPYYEACVEWMEIAAALPGFKTEKVDCWREASLASKNIGADYDTEGASVQALEYYQKRLVWLSRYFELGGLRDYINIYNHAVSNIDIGNILNRLERQEDAKPYFRDSNVLIDELKNFEEYKGTLDAFYKSDAML
jgi:tetratricopeptide (TPR) repeat protein